MKIGILTFHSAQNYGAYLQCFSLSKRIKDLFPEHTVEVIDYSSANLLREYEKGIWQKIFGANGSLKPSFVLVAKRLVKTLLHLNKTKRVSADGRKRKSNFAQVQKFLDLSQDRLVSDSAAEFRDFIGDKYDVLIVGSDAIWNDNQTSRTNLYLLHDIDNCVKLSYAASTYGMDFSKKTDAEIQYVGESLSSFYFVGTRDAVTEGYVTKSTNGEVTPVHTCDPSVFMELEKLPVDMEELKQKLINHGVDFSKPIIGLMCSSWLARQVRKHLGESYQYVSLYTRNGCEDVFLDDLNPFEWARAFSFFNATFTHYFHGTLFSLKNGTPTFSIEKNTDYKSRYETKIQDVLKRLGLLDECYYEIEKVDDSTWNAIKEKIDSSNKDTIKNRYLDKLAKESKSFDCFELKLREVLN